MLEETLIQHSFGTFFKVKISVVFDLKVRLNQSWFSFDSTLSQCWNIKADSMLGCQRWINVCMSTLNQRLYVSVYSNFKFKYIFNIISTYFVNVESTLNQQTRARWVSFALEVLSVNKFNFNCLNAKKPFITHFHLIAPGKRVYAIVKELGFWKLTWHNCPARKGLTSEKVRTTLLQHF